MVLSTEADRDITVDLSTQEMTATASADYTSVDITLVFSAGETSVSVTLDTLEDNISEQDETFAVFLSNPSSGVSLGDQNVTVINIPANDGMLIMSVRMAFSET